MEGGCPPVGRRDRVQHHRSGKKELQGTVNTGQLTNKERQLLFIIISRLEGLLMGWVAHVAKRKDARKEGVLILLSFRNSALHEYLAGRVGVARRSE